MSEPDKFRIRVINRDEIGVVIGWARSEGWSPGFEETACILAADPGGFLIGLLDDEPVACIAAIAYDDIYGYLSFYMVRPECRKKGFGVRLWQAGLQHLGGRTVGLDGVALQQENYEKAGFRLAYRNLRYQGLPGSRAPLDSRLVYLSEVAFDDLASYDDGLFPAPRHKFLRGWIRLTGCRALGLVSEGRLTGYGVVRPTSAGFKIGPLYADDADLAEALFRGLCDHVPDGVRVAVDTVEPNLKAAALAKRHRMEVVFETRRMYAGREPDVPLDRWFGVTGFLFG